MRNGGQVNGTEGITFNSKDHIIAADCDNHRILVLDQSMQFIKFFGSKGNESGQFHHLIALQLVQMITLLWLLIGTIAYKYLTRMETGSKYLGMKYLIKVNSIIHFMLLYAK